MYERIEVVVRAVGVGVLLAGGGAARAGVVYSNVQTAQGQFVASTDYWDDATIVGGGVLSGFSLLAYNAQAGGPRVLTTQVSIHVFDSANNLPNGALLGTFTIVTPPVDSGMSLLASTGDLSGLNIVLPANARLGVRMDFQSNSGVRMFDPPTVGSSADIFWRDNPPAPHSIAGRVGNLGFAMSVVPAPGALALFGAAVIGASRRRRA